MAAEQVPMLVPGGLLSRAAFVGARAAGAAAPAGLATAAAIGTNAMMQGADVASSTFDEAMKIQALRAHEAAERRAEDGPIRQNQVYNAATARRTIAMAC